MHPAAAAARVVQVVPSFPKLSETFIVSQFVGLVDRGWDLHIVCSTTDLVAREQFPELMRRPELFKRVHVTWPDRPRALAAALALPALLRTGARSPAALRKYIRRGAASLGKDLLRRSYLDAEIIALRPDLLHFEFGTLAVGRTYLKSLLDTRLVVSFRGYDLGYSGLAVPDYYAGVWRDADALHLLGEDLWREALKRGCPPDKPHRLIPPAIDLQKFTPPNRSGQVADGTPGKPVRILSVGRLEWKKGYEFALQAVQKLVETGVRCEYTIVGQGAFLEPVAFARHQLGLDEVVTLAGAQSPQEVVRLLGEADIFLHSAVSEGFCNAVIEAQAMEVPVVCSDATGLPENIRDGVTGFVAPRRDPVSMAEKLAHLARDPALRRTMGAAGRERVRTHFGIQDQIEAFDRMYRMVLSGAGDRSL